MEPHDSSRRRSGITIAIVVALIFALVLLLTQCGSTKKIALKPDSTSTSTTLVTLSADTTTTTIGGATPTAPPVDVTRSTIKTGKASAPWADFAQQTISFEDSAAVTPLDVLVATTKSERAYGLMNVTSLEQYQGMLFAWDEETNESFYMKDTKIALSVAFFDANARFVSSADMQPCESVTDDCPLYKASGLYRYAVEVPIGKFEGYKVGPGTILKFNYEAK